MIVQLQFMRRTQKIYTMNEQGQVVDAYECRDAFVAGYNEEGLPRASLPNGNYYVSAELVSYGPQYGTFYITTGDYRGRDIHGGGSACADPYAPRQGWHKTLGCLRMQNEDGENLAKTIIDSGNNMLLEVVDD